VQFAQDAELLMLDTCQVSDSVTTVCIYTVVMTRLRL